MRAGGFSQAKILPERQPLSQVSATDKEVKVAIELAGVSKEQIKINTNEHQVDVKTDDPKRKYHEVIDLPAQVDIENIKSTFINGLLEITFKKKSKDKTRGKTINVD